MTVGPNDGDGRHSAEQRFGRLYDAHYRDILAYALRRAVGPDRAADAVAETFLVAWRRLDEVPPAREARLWLFGVARRVLANQRRGAQRRDALVERLAAEISAIQVTYPDADDAAGTPDASLAEVGQALRSLSERDREVLTLVGWEGLGNQEVAAVLGCSHTAARIRIHRARRRLAHALDASTDRSARADGPTPVARPTLTEGLHR
jgi:RNA polymerase sigma-70 factor (ECF subfamily)